MDIENLKQCLQGHGIHYKPGPLPRKGFLMDRLIGRGVSEVRQFPVPTWVRVGPEIGLCYVLQGETDPRFESYRLTAYYKYNKLYKYNKPK